jgi:WS/DGAT/MGAT family acyltransferase
LRQNPAAAIDAVQRGWEALARAGRSARRPPPDTGASPPPLFSAPRTSINGTISARRRFATVSIPAGDLALVRRTFGTTSNDVVLAAVAGAVRRMLVRRATLPERSLVALVPVSTRRREHAGSLGNVVSGMLVALRTDVVDPGERLAAIAAGTRAAKARHRATRGRLLQDVAQLTPPVVTSGAVRLAGGLRLFDRLPPPFNLVVSHVPGPSTPLWCAGSRVVALHPVGPIAEGIGLNVTAFAYAGQVSFGLLGCRRLVPEVQDLAIMLDDAVADLVAAAAESQSAAG